MMALHCRTPGGREQELKRNKDTVRLLGANVYLAAWDYCTEKQRAFAEEEENITLLKEEKIYPVLNAALKSRK